MTFDNFTNKEPKTLEEKMLLQAIKIVITHPQFSSNTYEECWNVLMHLALNSKQ
jgi:hypothetical protein